MYDLKNIKDDMPFEARTLMNILNVNKHSVFIVGGAVRDNILNRYYDKKIEINDWDFITTATPEEMSKYFNKTLKIRNEMGRVINVKGSTELLIPTLGTTLVKIGRKSFEVTPIKDDIIADLKSRDFSINSIAVDYNGDMFFSDKWEIIRDFESRIIRCNNNDYVSENPISIIRALHFSNKLEFDIDETLLNIFKEECVRLNEINKGKLYMNFEKMILSKNELLVGHLVHIGLFSSICKEWNENFTSDFVLLHWKARDKYDSVKEIVKYIYVNFDEKEILVKLLLSFGMNNEFLELLSKYGENLRL